MLYTKSLTQEQAGEVFQDIYDEHYSQASITQMLEYLHEDVSQWPTRALREIGSGLSQYSTRNTYAGSHAQRGIGSAADRQNDHG